MRSLFLHILIVLIPGTGNCISPGDEPNGLVPGISIHYGFIIPHSRTIRSVSGSNPWGIEAEWNWQLMSPDAWNYCYCFPRTGVSFLYINFANPEILGSTYAPYVFIEPVLGAEKKLNSSIRFGFGPAFMDKVYDEQTNPENLFYSSYISFIVLLKASVNIRLSQQLNFRLQGNYNHISNGGIKNPNKGINFPTLSLGLDYNIRQLSYEKPQKTETLNQRSGKWRFDIVGFGTGKSDVKGEKRYAVFGISATAGRVIARLSALSAGIEGTVDKADQAEIERNQIMEDEKPADNKYVAVLFGHDLLIGRFVFSTHLGAYLYSPFKRRDPVYQRYGLTFKLNDWFYIGTNIKAHRQVADFLDFRAGISF